MTPPAASRPATPVSSAEDRHEFGIRSARRILLWIIAAWGGVLALQQMDVSGEWLPIEWSTWEVLGAWVAIFTLTYLAVLQYFAARDRKPAKEIRKQSVETVIVALTAIATAGAAMVIYDFAILRQYGFTTAVAEIRVLETTMLLRGMSDSSVLSGIGRLMLPALFPAIILLVRNWASLVIYVKGFFAACCVVILAEQLMFEGGRSFIISIFLTVVIALLFAPKGRSKRGVRRKLPIIRLALGSVVILSFVAYVFVDRILERNDFFWTAFTGFANDFLIQVHYDQAGRFEGPFGAIWFAISMSWIYATQGISELDQILAVPYFEHAWGMYQFPHIAQIAQVGFGLDWRYDLVAHLPNVGTFNTLYGALYIDFGTYGALVSASIIAVLTALSVFEFARGGQGGLALAGPILVAVCLFAPINSLMTSVWPAFGWIFGTTVVLTIRRSYVWFGETVAADAPRANV